MAIKVKKPKLKVEETPAGLRVNIPHEYSDVSAYYAERLDIDEAADGLMRLVRVDILAGKSSRDVDYRAIYGNYRKFFDQDTFQGKTTTRSYWERLSSDKTARSLGWKFTPGQLEYQAFEELSKRSRRQ